MDNHEALAARVRAVNRAHQYAKELFPKLRTALLPFVGQQIEKAEGGLLKKVRAVLPELPNTVSMSAYRSRCYALAWTISTSEVVPQPDGHGIAYYYEVVVYVGDLSNGVLTVLYDEERAVKGLRTDFTAEAVAQKREEYKAAKAVADAAHSALHPFGEHDR